MGDPLWYVTGLVCPFDTLADKSSHALPLTAVNGATIVNGELVLSGTARVDITATTAGPLDLRTYGTLECDVFRSSAVAGVVYSNAPGTGASLGLEVRINAAGFLEVSWQGTTHTATSGEIPLNTWATVAFVHNSGTLSLYVNGQLARTPSSLGGAYSEDTRFRIGARSIDLALPFQGRLKNLRITRGARYLGSAYTPPATFPLEFGVDVLRVDGIRTLATVPLFDFTVRALPAPGESNRYFSGRAKIANGVFIKGPPEAPISRRVVLYDELTRNPARETWSDPVTGAYLFDWIDPNLRYTAIAYDHLNNYRAVVADNLTPVPR